jgi:hypothetical protein
LKTNSSKTHTWNRRRVLIVIAIALAYGAWFNVLDSLAYCPNQVQKSCDEKCPPVSIGSLFGGDYVYQPWNVIGHLIPGLFLACWTPKRVELFVAGALISSVIMDSPLWGVLRLEHGLPLWYMNESGENFVNTCNLGSWISYYYDPIGSYPVWNNPIGFPTAALLFWSLIGRSLGAGLLIWWQARQEKQGKEFSLPRLVLNIRKIL